MISPCRQCILNSQRGAIDYISINKNTINLNVQKQPIIAVFAHGDTNYLLKLDQSRTNQWVGWTNNCWLYWDIDLLTAKLTNGITNIEPSYGPLFPSLPVIGENYFNTSNWKMYEWSGDKWIEKIRLFVGKILDGRINPYPNVSQINDRTSVICGEIIFDHKQRPIRRFNDDGTFSFITTETFKNFQHVNLSNYVFSQGELKGIADENLTKLSCVRWNNSNTLVYANYTDNYPAIAVIQENYLTNEIVKITTHGFIKNINWNWTESENTSLFVGLNGEISTNIPTNGSIQKIGYIVDPKTIFIRFSNQIFINPIEISTTPTPTPSFTPTLSITPSQSITPTPPMTPTVTSTLTPTPSRTPSRTPTPTISPSITPTSTPNITLTITPTPAVTITNTTTPTVTPTITNTITPTITLTPTVTPSYTPTITPSINETPSPTLTPTITNTITPTLTPSVTVTPTTTISVTPTLTPSVTVTPTESTTPTPTVSNTITPTITPSVTPTEEE